MLESLLQDIRFGARVLVRTPLIAFSIIGVLTLGIGANSAMFAVLDGLLLHSIHYPDPNSLVFVWSVDAQGAISNASPADFVDWRARVTTASDLAAWTPTSFNFLGGERPRQLGGARVTANFFQTIRVKPILGRTFLPDEDGLEHPQNASNSVVISEKLWREELGSDPNVLGRTIRLDSASYTVVGVMPADFQFWWRPHDVWIPARLNVRQRDYRNLAVIARIGAPRSRVQAEMDQIARSLSQEYPKSDKGWTVQVESFQERFLNHTFRMRLVLLSAAVGLVLLIACANITGLLLTRSAARSREFAVRISLGATGGRLARQLLTECALLALAGGAFGCAVAWALVRAIPAFVPAGALPRDSVELGSSMIWFSLAASAVTCLLVGLAPAVSAARSERQGELKHSGRGTAGSRSRQRFRQTLVAGELALALILLASAWLMARGLRTLTTSDPGFDPGNVLSLRVVLPAAKYDAAHSVAFCQMAQQQIANLPGVESASLGTALPLNTGMRVRFDRADSPRDEAQQPSAAYAAVGPDYFRTLRIPLKLGRLFTDTDNEHAPLMAIVSETLASRYLSDQNPIGKSLVVYRPVRGGEEKVNVEIAGVVGDINLSSLSFDTQAMMYVPYAQNPYSRAVQFALRSRGNPGGLASAVRSVFGSIDREQPVEQMATLDQLMTDLYAEPRFQTELMGAFSGLALTLAAIGIYGVNAYTVMQRRSEIGLRIALGATHGAVLREIIARGLTPIGIGIGAGLAGTAAMTTLFRSVVVGAGRPDPMVIFGAALLLAGISILACYIPARRAAQIDPAITLRTD